jgi:N-acetyl-S-(2-succino)cysteine monooxygenase
MARMMHLGEIVIGTGAHVGGWRLPESRFGSQNFDLIRDVVAAAERGKFDFVFFADALNTTLDAHPGFMLRFEPLSLLGALATTTSRIGLVATVSTTYSEPYNVARSLATIDHISNGRAGWNVVTTANERTAENFGLDHHPEHKQRYDMAEEFLTVSKGLWDSWEDGALLGDKASGRYVDPAKMHELNHDGDHFRVRGPLNIDRPPQGYPVIFQAGASDRGIEFAGATAEIVFAAQQSQEEALAFRQKIRDAAVAAGRSPDAVKILCGVCPIVGDTKQAAMEQVTRLGALADPSATMRVLSDRTGYDMTQFPLDEPVPDLKLTTSGTQGHARQLLSLARREKLTVRQLRDLAAASIGHRLVMGTPTEIADDLEAWYTSGATDGFVLMSLSLPGSMEDFRASVVPILVSRGLFRAEYEGSTLRDHLGLARPEHPAIRTRRTTRQ